MFYFRLLCGYLMLIILAWLFSENKKQIDWRLVVNGFLLQAISALLLIKVPFVSDAFMWISKCFVKLLSFTHEGSSFLFGSLVNDPGLGFIFVCQVLPVVVFFSALSAVLYYSGILQKVVYVFAWVMSRSMRLSGAESLSAAGNIFLGQTEAPLLVKPYLENMSRSEMMCVMTCGMATIAGSVMAAYITFLGGNDPVAQASFAFHLLTASVLNTPSGIIMAKIMVPEKEFSEAKRNLQYDRTAFGHNFVDALSLGASDGMKLAANVAAMLLAFVAATALFNYLMLKLGAVTGLNTVIHSYYPESAGFTLEWILGFLFKPIAFMIGIPWSEAGMAGSLIGEKLVINEFVAYLHLSEWKNAGSISPVSVIICTYALCGFANFSSIGIQLGGIGFMAPHQRPVIASLGVKAVFASTLACLCSGIWAGVFFG